MKRTITAAILLSLVVSVVEYSSRLIFFLCIQAIILAALYEFYKLGEKRDGNVPKALGMLLAVSLGLSFLLEEIPLEASLFFGLLILGVYFVLTVNSLDKLPKYSYAVSTTLFGALYVGFTMNFFLLLRDEFGPPHIYFLFAVIFLGDTGAYIFGKLLGKHKLAPVASPRKTWEGSVAGVLTACLGGVAARSIFLPDALIGKAVLIACVIHVIAQISDPWESLFKRAVGVKDSSNMLPGHGGFLDRIDSLILAAPLYYFLLKYLGLV